MGNYYLRNRYYDPDLGRFISEDPAKDGLNWYVYCVNNPITFVDPWGSEYIVVSGSEYDEGRWKYNFIEPAITKLHELRDSNSEESITWIVSATGYSQEALNKMKKVADDMNVSFVTIESSGQLQNYMNSKNIHDWYLSDQRKSDKIHKVAFFSHGLIGSVALGYHQSNASELQLDYAWTRGLSSEAFDSPNTAFYSCNAGTDKGGEWFTSFAQHWVNVTGGRSWAPRGKTAYDNIMNEVFSNKWTRWGGLFAENGSDNFPVASPNVEWMNFYKR